METFNLLLKNRRSVRNFQNKPVTLEIIKDIIHESTLAPSSGNEQPWQFIIITNQRLLTEISHDCKKTLLQRITNNPDDYAKKYENLLSNKEFNIFYNAPALVYIVGPKNLKNTEINCSIAASYFMLSATDRGLGTCWINFAKSISDYTLKEKLGLDPELLIVAPIIIGFPEILPQQTDRNPATIIKILES